MNGRRGNDEWFGEKRRKERRERSRWKEEEGETESKVKSAKTLAWVEKRKNGEDGCMMMKRT